MGWRHEKGAFFFLLESAAFLLSADLIRTRYAPSLIYGKKE